ncbi:MAG: hypothetical protein HKN82_15480 [Akkermansiaceae bacterium]|nr:hypothetical protein [Akkermansiaceae bacterium]NNM28062.1 hypothetical protein [Akkermansiaceae bacterium]
MKTISALLLLGLAEVTANPESEYINFIRQIQLDTNTEWDVTVPKDGTMLSPEGVGIDGSQFELWSIHDDSNDEYLLDEEYVASYMPWAKLSIVTGDPYPDTPRTRVDQPFTVQIEIDGLVYEPDYVNSQREALSIAQNVKFKPKEGKVRRTKNHPFTWEAPPDAAKVLLVHEIFHYPEDEDSFNGEYKDGVVVQEAFLTENAASTLNYGMTNLQAEDLTLARGEEVFTITSLAGYKTGETILRTEKVQIWPIARGSLSGIDSAEVYNSLPPLTVALEDLYPSSTTFVRVYKGAPVAEPASAEMVIDSFVYLDDSIPRNRNLSLVGLDRYFQKDGLYTVELVHRTPFGAELLDQVAVTVDRRIEVRGSFYSNE